MECVTESKIKDRVNQTAMNHGCSDGIPWGYVCLLVRSTRGLVVLNVWRLPKLTQNSRHFFSYEKDIKEKQKLLKEMTCQVLLSLRLAVLFRDSGNNFKSVQLEEEKVFWI